MPRKLTYNFLLADGTSWEYQLEFDDAHFYVPKLDADVKEWTKLDFNKCPHCPLSSAAAPQCPIARNLNKVVEDSKGTLSITRARVTVDAPERTYVKECATQDGLRSLFGVIMATSGCPHLDWLRPLARFHLPFAEIDETLFRVLSLQLVEQFLSNDNTPIAQCSKKIEERYKNVEKVNHSFIQRIRSYCKADADKNAIAALDVFVQLFPFQMESKFESLRKLFKKEAGR